LAVPGDPNGFPSKDEIADYLEQMMALPGPDQLVKVIEELALERTNSRADAR
jgi:hypothetical protein